MVSWHNESVESVGRKLSSTNGLDKNQVDKRLKEFGENISAKEKKTTALEIFLRQFKSFIIYILLGAAIISRIIGDRVEFIVILSIVLFIVLLSFFEEYKATKEMESLKKLTPKTSKVIREGKQIIIDSSELVPGDILILERGDLVPADARVTESVNFQIDESALTGESVPVTKQTKPLPKKTLLAERKNMVYAGGQVTNGHGVCIIVGTAKNTELGKIASMVKDAGEEISPLQKRLDKLGKQVSYAVIMISLFIVVFGFLNGENISYLLLVAVAVAVSGIPESLPAVIGVALAIGMKRMAKRNAVIKRLAAVETLGTCTVICSDKTGTLTQNKMVIENMWTPSYEIKVTGNGFEPKGTFLKNGKKIDPLRHKDISKMIEIGLLCNNSELHYKDKWTISGESTEGALVVLGKKAGVNKEEFSKASPRLYESPFDADRKLMSTVNKNNKKTVMYAKGAPERIIAKASSYFKDGKVKKLNKTEKERILAQNNTYAKKGYRVLALAYKESSSRKEDNLVFVGLVSIRDPPEPNALESIKLCNDAGIKVVMITGDNPLTAKAIAQELQIIKDDALADKKILTGEMLDSLSDEAFKDIVDDISVYARVTPKHKLRVIKALQENGEIVAMTGDGVNDAPALKKADIGVAMGVTGTEVAKEASEMVLKDDNFSTIVHAVKEGRTIYTNIQKFIYYLLPGNLSEVLLILIATLVGFLPPLTPLMILFINIVTSDVPALGLASESSDDSIMHESPRSPKEGILNSYILLKISQVVPIFFLGTLSLYLWEINVAGADLVTAQTIAFTTLIFFELFHVFNAKSFNKSVFSKESFDNKYLLFGILISIMATCVVLYVPAAASIFGTVPLTLSQWVPVLIVSSLIMFFIEMQKLIIRSELKEREKSDLHPTRDHSSP